MISNEKSRFRQCAGLSTSSLVITFQGESERGVRDRPLAPFPMFERTPSLECRDPHIGLESMPFRFDHRIAQQICAGNANPGPGRPGDRATTPRSYLMRPPHIRHRVLGSRPPEGAAVTSRSPGVRSAQGCGMRQPPASRGAPGRGLSRKLIGRKTNDHWSLSD